MSLGSGTGGAAKAAADAAELFAVTREACSHPTPPQQPAADQQVLQLTQQLAQARDPGELQAAASSAAAWLAQQGPHPAAQLLVQLVAALQGGSSGTDGAQQQQPSTHTSGTASPALVVVVLGGSLRPHQLFQQCGQLRGEKAALERLNAELSSQVGHRHAHAYVLQGHAAGWPLWLT